MVDLLIANNANVDLSNNDGTRPLHVACKNGHAAVVELLIDNKADVNRRCVGGSPLYIACENGHLEVVDLLIKRNADVNWLDPDDESSPIEIAKKHGHLKVVELLKKSGAKEGKED